MNSFGGSTAGSIMGGIGKAATSFNNANNPAPIISGNNQSQETDPMESLAKQLSEVLARNKLSSNPQPQGTRISPTFH